MNSRDYLTYWISRYGFVLLICGFLLLVISVLAFLPRVQDPDTTLPTEAASLGTAGESGDPSPVADPPAKPAKLNIASDEVGATVMIDFDSVGTTPLYDHLVPPGLKIVSIRSGTIQRDTVIDLASQETRWIFMSAYPENIASVIPSDPTPPPARPDLESSRQEETTVAKQPDNRQRTTPRRNQTPPRQNTTPKRDPVVVEPDPPAPVLGAIRILSDPPGAQVIFNGLAVGNTPLELADLAAGSSQLQIAKEGYTPSVRQVEIVAGQQIIVNENLSPADIRGTLTVLVNPWGSIYIDGELRKRETDQQYSTRLAPGSYVITAVHPKLGTKSKTVTIQAGQTNAVVLDL